MRILALASALALFAFAPSARADAIALSSAEPARLDGEFRAVAPAGSLRVEATRLHGDLVAHGLNGTIRVWTDRQAAAVVLGNGTVGNYEDAEFEEMIVENATLVVSFDGGAHVSVVARSDGAIEVASSTRDAGFPFVMPQTFPERLSPFVDWPFETSERVPWAWEEGWPFVGRYAPSGPQFVGFPALDAPSFRATGAVAFDVLGGTAILREGNNAERAWRLGVDFEGPHRGYTYAGEIHVRTLVFEGVAGAVAGPVADDWGLAAPSMEWSLDGAAWWTSATGTATRAGESVAFADARVELAGVVRLSAVPGHAVATLATGPAAYDGEGGFTALAVNGDPVGRAFPPRATAAAGLSLAALLVALLLDAPRALALRIGLALYTRLAREDLLAHPRRAAIHRAIAERPGIHLRELHRAVGGGWGIFRAHFDLLLRAGYLRVVPQGKYVAVYLASADEGSPAIPSGVARAAFAALPADGRAIPVAEVRAASGASRQLLNYHLKALEQRGLVRFMEDARGSRCVARAAAGAPNGERTVPKATAPESA